MPLLRYSYVLAFTSHEIVLYQGVNHQVTRVVVNRVVCSGVFLAISESSISFLEVTLIRSNK